LLQRVSIEKIGGILSKAYEKKYSPGKRQEFICLNVTQYE
jgi:hypothetical protein